MDAKKNTTRPSKERRCADFDGCSKLAVLNIACDSGISVGSSSHVVQYSSNNFGTTNKFFDTIVNAQN